MLSQLNLVSFGYPSKSKFLVSEANSILKQPRPTNLRRGAKVVAFISFKRVELSFKKPISPNFVARPDRKASPDSLIKVESAIMVNIKKKSLSHPAWQGEIVTNRAPRPDECVVRFPGSPRTQQRLADKLLVLCKGPHFYKLASHAPDFRAPGPSSAPKRVMGNTHIHQKAPGKGLKGIVGKDKPRDEFFVTLTVTDKFRLLAAKPVANAPVSSRLRGAAPRHFNRDVFGKDRIFAVDVSQIAEQMARDGIRSPKGFKGDLA